MEGGKKFIRVYVPKPEGGGVIRNCLKKLFLECPGLLGADFKNNQTTKRLNNYIWTNRKQVNFCFCFLLAQIELFNCLVVGLFLKSAP